MADVVVLASGSGTNFQAIADRLATTPHRIVALVCNRRSAFAVTRAGSLGIPVHIVRYKPDRDRAEDEILRVLSKLDPDLVVLAGFMKILPERIVRQFWRKIVNIHPALLPRHPGAHAIEESFASADEEVGVTIHYVDTGVDTGPIILQRSIPRIPDESIEAMEARIHDVEHEVYPAVVAKLLDEIDSRCTAEAAI